MINGQKKRETNKEFLSAIADHIFNAYENCAKKLKIVGQKEYAETNERKMQIKKQAKLQSFSNILNYENRYKIFNNFSMHQMSLKAFKIMQYFIFWKGDKIKN